MSRDDVRRTVSETMNPQVSSKGMSFAKLTLSQNAPAWVWFVGEDGTPGELPKTASGKVMKHVLRELSTELAQGVVGRVGGQ